VLSGRGFCDELITRPEESYGLCCVVVCDLETSRMGAPYIYDISRLRVNTKRIILYNSEIPSEILSDNYNTFFCHSQCYSTVAFLSSLYMGRRKFLSTDKNILEDGAAIRFRIEMVT